MNNKDPKGFYAILGISPSASAEGIKLAFKRKAMELHPDRNPAPEATRQFQLVNAAYAVLSDPEQRADYDTATLEVHETAQPNKSEAPPEPIVCSCCDKVTAQPRYTIFYEVKSFLLFTQRSTKQGVFCSECAGKQALKSTAITWLLGWWGVPWGPIYSIQALFINMLGGKQPTNVNARLAAYQAWVFALLGKAQMARAIALEATKLAKKATPDARTSKEEIAELRTHIDKLFAGLGGAEGAPQLKDAWVVGQPFYIQAGLIAAAVGAIWIAVAADGAGSRSYSSSSSYPSYDYTRRPAPPVAGAQSEPEPLPATKAKPPYVRPVTAPNGEPWPMFAAYLQGFQQTHKDGHSKITVDNTRNDSDVFCKLYTMVGGEDMPVQVFFINAGGRFTLTDVSPGKYDLRYQDLKTGHLSKSESFTVSESETYEGIRYSDMTMTLYKVQNGNMKTYSLDESQF